MTRCKYDTGSFRDRDARVFRVNEQVFRGLSKTAKSDWSRLRQTGFYKKLVSDKKLVRTKLLEVSDPGLSASLAKEWEAVLSHETIPFISYPYEWSFSMLKDAALLHLDILLKALEEDMICKDASSYNIQWCGVNPIFIDITSFQSLRQGGLWVGYLQFCELFLYPLLLKGHRGIPFQSWLRGSIDGIKVTDINALFGWSSITRPGVLKHIKLQAAFQRRFGSTQRNFQEDMGKSGFSKNLIKGNLEGLVRVINGMNSGKSDSVWINYQDENNYSDDEVIEKKSFLENIISKRHWGLVWDIGSNTGDYSKIAAKNSDYVVAMDSDADTVDKLYNTLVNEKCSNIIPLVMDIKDPSPNWGWRGLERKSITDRGSS